MAVPPIAATRAYSAAARLSELGGAAAPDAPRSGTGFADLIGSSLRSVAEAGRQADAAQQNYLAGKADVVDVVTAVADVEMAFDSMVAIRDRVISAYDDIMKMPI